jgi:DNA-directed RNA polymerase specialized sigma24 family protein
MIKQAEHTETFEQVLLSYAERGYAVAFALTRDPDRARDLARHVLTSAWHLRDGTHGKREIKTKLLTALRNRFLKNYNQTPCRQEQRDFLGEGMICTARNMEQNAGKVSHDIPRAMYTP